MPNSEGKKRSIGQVKTTQKRKRKSEYIRMNAAGVEPMKGSESTQEEKYRILVQNIPCAVYSAYPGKAGPTTFMSNKWKDWTGYSPEEFYQNSEAWPRCIHRDDREHTVNTYIEACRDRIAYNLEYRIVHKDTGQLRYVRDQGHLSKDKKGAVVRVDGIVTDITELKKANNELDKYKDRLEGLVRKRTAELTNAYETLKEENKERKRAEQALHYVEREKSTVLENLSDLIVYRDRDMGTLWASKSMANWHGMSQDQIIGRVCYKARYGLDEPCEKCHVIEAMKSGQRQELEKQLPDERFWHVIVNPVLSDSGQVIGTIEVSQDITERKKADEEFRKSKDILEKTFTSLDSALFILDAKDPPVIIDCNPAATRIFGYEKEEMLGKTTEFLHISREKLLEFQKALNQSIEEQGGLSFFEFKMQRKDGQVFPSEHSVRPLKDDKGRIIGWISVVRDITERKQSEEALRETTNLLETIFEHTHMLAAYLDAQFNFVRVNRAYAEADEHEPSFFPGKNHFDLYPNEENEVIFRRVVETGVPYIAYARPFEYAEHPERGVSYWDWSLVPIKNQQGIVSGLVLTLADVTARKRAEEALKDSEGKLNAMLQSISDHMSMMDKDLNIIWVNEKAMNIFGDDIVGRKCYEAYHGRNESCEPHPCLTLKVFEDGMVHEHDSQVVDKDGKSRYFHCSANVALRDEQGKPTAVLEISKDITDQKLAEEALRESENSYRAVVENAAEGIVVVQGKTLQFVNPALVSMIGYSKEELLTRPFIEFIHPDHRDRALGIHIKRLKGEEVPPIYELKVLDKKGNVKWLENSGILIEWHDRPATLNFLRDITEQKLAKEQIERLAKFPSENPNPVLRVAKDGKVMYSNDPGLQLLAEWESGIGKVVPERWRRLVANACKSGKDRRQEEEFRDKVFSFVISPVVDSGYANLYGSNVTERKRAEDALRTREQTLRALLNAPTESAILVDAKGTILDINRIAAQRLGKSAKSLIGMGIYDYLPTDIAEYRKAQGYEVVRSGKPVRFQDERGGSYYDNNIYPVFDNEGKVSALAVFSGDITERKRAEQALRESEERLKILFESAPDTIYLIDSEGRFVDGNRAAMELIGFDRDDVIGKSLAEMGLLSAGQLSKAIANLKKVAAGKLSGPNEYTLKRKDGTHVSVEVRTFPVKIEGKMLTLGIARDITEHKRTEKELLEHQAKLKSLASQLSLTEEHERHRLATELHDQISQSLVISKIKLDQLRKSSTSDEFNKPLEDICNCLGQIIDDTRTLTFDLSYPILYELGFEAAVAEWLTDQIQEKHGIRTEFLDDGHQKPLDDDIRVLLFRNVRELLINVVKHAQANKVRVSIRKIKDNIRVSVEDDGVGFDPVEVTSIAAKRAEFGLFSIRERLEQLEGLIEIESGPAHGSKITMTAPLKYDNSTDRTQK